MDALMNRYLCFYVRGSAAVVHLLLYRTIAVMLLGSVLDRVRCAIPRRRRRDRSMRWVQVVVGGRYGIVRRVLSLVVCAV